MIPFETIDMSKYQSAVEHPKNAFGDPDLASMRVAKNSLGWPAAQSGNFAIVYRLIGRDRITSREEVVAVRCFKKLAPDLAERYRQICISLDSAAPASKYLLGTRYLAKGIKIDTGWKPVTTLKWVDGVSLDRYLDSVHSKLHVMERLRSQLRNVARDLERAGIAHCDLQHRNILLDGTGTIRLIDYDGMYVGALQGHRTNELGHPDFQHPGRDDGAIFGPTLDRFSLISIYLQLFAISRHPELWATKERTEGLLLRRDDYLDPDGSPMFRALRTHDDLRAPVDLFRRICAGSIGDVPSLTAYLTEVGLDPRSNAPPLSARPQQPVAPADSQPVPLAPAPKPAAPTLYMPVIPSEPEALRRRAGDEVMVVGRWTNAQLRKDPAGGYATSLFLRTLGVGTFSILVEGPTARQFAALGKGWTVKPGGWLAATGLLMNKGDDYVILVDQMAQLERLGVQEAHRRLNTGQWKADSDVRRKAPMRTEPKKGGAMKPRPSSTAPASSPSPEVRRGSLVFKDFAQLGEVLGRTGTGKTDHTKKERR